MKRLIIVISMLVALSFCALASSCGCQNQSSNSEEGATSVSQSDFLSFSESSAVSSQPESSENAAVSSQPDCAEDYKDIAKNSSSAYERNNAVVNINDLE